MNLEEIKKSTIDEPEFDEKVLLACQTIIWFAVRNEKMFQQFKQVHNAKVKEKDTIKIIDNIIKNHSKYRNMVLKSLNKILENWGTFLDGQDAVDAIDEIVTTPTYDILNNRYQEEEKLQVV